tara:strand:- start:690 stop:926 length:237 start_codon:yes stop_codon:yes gene_type:complete
VEIWSREWFCKGILSRKRKAHELGGELVMSTAEWFGFIIFLIILSLLFFAAFGGSRLNDQSVEEYMARLIKEGNENGP